MENLSRRKWMKGALASAGTLALIPSSVKAAVESCVLTPAQTEGPFYPIEDQEDKDNDLTSVRGKTGKALGEVIIMKGVVMSQNCKPVAGALVEIWQACTTGKYNHPGDPNPAQLDPNFQYWGRAITNEQGEYSFKTIRPGHYQATSTWMRPAHIHFKTSKRGYRELTSQMYFSDDRYNAKDRILQELSSEEQKRVIVDFKKIPLSKHKVGTFNITLQEY